MDENRSTSPADSAQLERLSRITYLGVICTSLVMMALMLSRGLGSWVLGCWLAVMSLFITFCLYGFAKSMGWINDR